MLKYVLLGFLARGPRHGYELKSVFDRSLGRTWTISAPQVYAALSKLEQEGLISCSIVHQEQVPDRKVYQLTDAGTAALKTWLDETIAGPVQLRDAMLLKVIVALMTAEDPMRVIWDQRQAHMQTLADLSRQRNDPTVEWTTYLLLSAAILKLESELRWLDLCEEYLMDRSA